MPRGFSILLRPLLPFLLLLLAKTAEISNNCLRLWALIYLFVFIEQLMSKDRSDVFDRCSPSETPIKRLLIKNRGAAPRK